MDDLDLDQVLRRSAPVPPDAAVDTALLVARQVQGVASGAEPLRRRRRPNWVAATAVAATLSLTGAGSLAAYQLGIPPFQGLEEGVQRAMTGIPVQYTNSLNQDVECLAFIEYRNLDAGQRDRIEQVGKDEHWDGYGQRVLDSLAMPDASPEDQQSAVLDVLDKDLRAAALTAVPTMSESDASNGPVLAGWSTSCDIVRERG